MLNDSELVDFVGAVAHPEGGGADGYYLVKNPIWRSSEDVVQLRRLERSVNLTMHESQTDNKKILDVRVHLGCPPSVVRSPHWDLNSPRHTSLAPHMIRFGWQPIARVGLETLHR